MNKPSCNYRKKQPAKSKPEPKPAKTRAPRRRGSIGTKRPVEPLQPTLSGGDTLALSRGPSALDSSSVLSLKRCRLSASPATGLVGMQENAFLTDYFACLGFLPLASTSMVREAMVKIMLGSMPQQREGAARVGEGGRTEGEQARLLQQGEARGWGQTLAPQDKPSYPSECILWCTIALGALVQGCSSEFVTGYVRLARDSLAECFDGTTIETARAYLVMAFLHSFLGDQPNNQKYLAFANSIVERLPQDAIPPGMEQMLLSEGDEARLFHYGCRGSGIGGKLKAKSEYSNKIPAVKNVVHESDLCHFFFLADRYWHKAFLEDVRSGGNSVNITGGGGQSHDWNKSAQLGEFREQREFETKEGAGSGLGATSRSRVLGKDAVKSRGRRAPPSVGAAMRTCVRDVLPELANLLVLIQSSGTCSGVGGFVLHGGMAYMKAVKGDMRGSFEALKVSARVLMRFPGICRYRPHLVHAVLAAAASTMCRNIYDPVREIYNSILPWNGTPAPPMEEWGGMSCICNHIFCRSLQAGTINMGCTPSDLVVARKATSAAPVSRAPSSGLYATSVARETCQSLDRRAPGPSPVAATVGVAGTVSAAPYFANGVSLPSSTAAQPFQRRI